MLPVFALLMLILVHVFTAKLRFLEGTPRSWFLSLAGGASVAYVFIHLLPEIAHAQREITLGLGSDRLADYDVWLLAMLGLVVFYGLDRVVLQHHAVGRENANDSNKEADEHGIFWVHLASFALYNVITGILLVHREDQTVLGLGLFAIAMALHFFSTDYGLSKDYRSAWLRIGRWVLSAALVVGVAIGFVAPPSELWLASITAFLGGGIILNVMREELPAERQSRFGAFALGVTAYTMLLIFL